MFTLPQGLLGSPRRYPTTADEMRQACGGYGVWSAGWLCNETSGNLEPAFGGTSLTPAGTPTYNAAGPLDAADRAIQLGPADANGDYFTAGDIYNGGTWDVGGAIIFRLTAAVASTRHIFGKRGSATTGWHLQASTGGTSVAFVVTDATDSILPVCTISSSGWNVVVFGWDSTEQRGAVASQLAASASTAPTPGAIGNISNSGTASFAIGRVGSTTAAIDVAAAYVIANTTATPGMPSNIAGIARSLASYIGLSA